MKATHKMVFVMLNQMVRSDDTTIRLNFDVRDKRAKRVDGKTSPIDVSFVKVGNDPLFTDTTKRKNRPHRDRPEGYPPLNGQTQLTTELTGLKAHNIFAPLGTLGTLGAPRIPSDPSV